MTRAAGEAPSFTAIAVALRKTTEHLAREVADPCGSPPEWTEFEWAIARSVAAMQGISFLLAKGLRWKGPPAWQSFLEQQREQCLLRDAVIGRLLERLDAATRDAGIGCLGMKGAALRALDVYGPGERPMGDVDLLVRKTDLLAAAAMMARLGYVGTTVPGREIIYQLPRTSPVRLDGEHADNPLKVEVHMAVAEPLPVRTVDITARLWPTNARSGINAYPSFAVLLLHCLLRTASNMRAHSLRQIQLHDIAMLTRRMRTTDWESLLEESSSAEERWWMYPPLALTARYYRCGTPAEVLRELRAACPPLLRVVSDREVLTDVSWSNLRISAFPGMAWSRTAGDALRYARSRALPSRNALATIEVAVAQQPQLETVPWYQLSHGKRIMRWLVSRPPRVQTLTSVMASLRAGRGERVGGRSETLAPSVRFFVAGVPKAGTTALCQFLGQHSQVFMCPIKEPTFFAARELLAFEPQRSGVNAKAAALERWLAGETLHRPDEGFALEWRHYEALFRDVRAQRAIGEGSVTYWWAPGAVRGIRDKFPDARFVVVLRNPADRFFSQYLASRWTDPLRTLRDCIDMGLAGREEWGLVLDVGRYAAHLERFFGCFARDQFSIHLYEDFCANPQAVCREIFAFLGVDPNHPIDVSGRVNEPSLPRSPRVHAALLSLGASRGMRWTPHRWREPLRRVFQGGRSREAMSAADRGVLTEHYRDEVRKTAELIGRDLSAWLR